MKTIHHLAAACYLAATLLAGIGLASCTEEVYTPGADADLTTQPLILTASMAASADAPATRANTANDQWTAGDVVAVEVNDVVKKYLVHLDNGVATLRPADIDNTHFWPDLEQSVSVRAWRYGHGRDWNVVPESWSVESNQASTASNGESHYQHSDFLYAPEKSISYSSGDAAGLTFYHQTTRIVVHIREAGMVTADNKGNINVRFGYNAYLDGLYKFTFLMAGIFDEDRIHLPLGPYSGLRSDTSMVRGCIVPKPIPQPGTGYALSYEALVMPQNMSNKALVEVEINGKQYYYTPTNANLLGGYTYTYDITVSEHGTLQVSASKPILGWEDSEKGGSGMAHEVVIPLNQMNIIDDNRTYLLTGTKENVQNLLNISGGTPTIILRDLDIKGNYPISIHGGTPTFKVEGENRIITISGPIIGLYGKTSNVHIIGDGRDKSQLTAEVTTDDDCPAIGCIKEECGSISLSDIKLIAKGSSNADMSAYAAAIGTSGKIFEYIRICGPITITDCHVEATAGGPGAAAIGFGYYEGYNEHYPHEMGNITITNSTIKCTVEQGPNGVWPAHIGGSANETGQYTVGKITITPPEGTHGTEFFRDFTKGDGSAMHDTDVIVGFPQGAKPTNGAEFDVYWNNRSLGPVIRWGDRGGLQ